MCWKQCSSPSVHIHDWSLLSFLTLQSFSRHLPQPHGVCSRHEVTIYNKLRRQQIIVSRTQIYDLSAVHVLLASKLLNNSTWLIIHRIRHVGTSCRPYFRFHRLIGYSSSTERRCFSPHLSRYTHYLKPTRVLLSLLFMCQILVFGMLQKLWFWCTLFKESEWVSL